MPELCVPYLSARLAKDKKLPERYLLYTVRFDRETKNPWKPAGTETDEAAEGKFQGLQEYFEKRHYTHSCPGEFVLRTLNPIEEICPIAEVLDNQTPSVFLGIFLKAVKEIQGREFKNKWDIICATGDLKYDETSGRLNLVSVDDINIEKPDEKHNKYIGEFLELADAGENKSEKYLFLSIGDTGEPEREGLGKHGNITVKQFSSNNTVYEVIDFIFKPFTFNFNYRGLDSVQKKLLENMEKQHGIDYGYIPGANFHELERIMLNDTWWRGFFIYGEGGSGKSAAAMAAARYLVWMEMIYAPVWIKINNDEITGIIEKEAAESINIMEKASRDEIEAYLAPMIYSQVGQDTDNPERQYMVIIDNLELDENRIIRILSAVEKIFAGFANKPYLTVTSRIKCDDSPLISRLRLREERASKLNGEETALFIKNIADNKGTVYAGKIKTAEENNTFKDLAELLFEKLGDFPDMVITAVGLLDYMTVPELCNELKGSLGGNEQKIRHKRIKIFQVIFSYLDTLQKQVLYFFLAIGEDTPLPADEIFKKIHESQAWKETPLKKSGLTEILRILLRYNLIYSAERGEETVYGIKSLAYHAFMFESEFLGPLTGSGGYLRDIFVDLSLQLEKALRYNQDTEVIKQVLEKMKAKGVEITKEHLFTAAEYCKDPEMFSMLYTDFGCDIKVCDEYQRNASIYAVRGNNKIALDWFFQHAPELIKCKTDSGWTVFFFAAVWGNPAVLDWMFQHVPELKNGELRKGVTACHFARRRHNTKEKEWLLKHAPESLVSKADSGETVFHSAVFNKDISVLDWLYQKIPELLKCKNNKGYTVFHSAAGDNSNPAVLDWLFQRVPELLNCKTNDGLTVFHYAVGKDSNPAVLDWLFQHVPELLNCKTNDGLTIFHYAVRDNNTAVLDWLFQHVSQPLELLQCKDNDGYTVFHFAVENNNAAVLDWLFQHASQPKELLACKNNYGKTVFHSAAGWGNPAVLDWLFQHAPELLQCKNNDGWTVFHFALEKNNAAVLDWLFQHVSQPKELLQCKDNDGYTVFYFAVENNNAAVLDWLFQHVSQPKELLACKNNYGRTVFHSAAGWGNTAVLDWLFQHISHPLELLNCKNNDGYTVFHFALEKNNAAVLDWLFQHISQPQELLNCKDNDGWTVFHSAAQYSNVATFEWLLQHMPEFNINERTNIGYTALNLAIQKNNTGMVKRLLHEKAEPIRYEFTAASASTDDMWDKYKPLCLKAKEIDDETKIDIFPLMEAVTCNEDEQILELLLSEGYPPDAKNKLGQTPLMGAALNPNPQMAITLMKHGADPEIQDCNGRTALSYLKEHEQCELILEKAGITAKGRTK
jgi:ankyrin repeat protein